MDITSSMLRKAAEFHKTQEGKRCIRAVVKTDKGTRFVNPSDYELTEPEDLAHMFTRCPVCGEVFE